jgi:hypothetical protein
LKNTRRRCDLEEWAEEIFEVSRTRCTGLRADGQLVLAGFKESAQDAFLRAQDAFVRLFIRFSGARRCDWATINSGSSCTRCTRVLRNGRVEPKTTDLKESAEDAFAGLREAFFWSIPRIFHSKHTLPFISTRGYGCTCILQNIRAEATSRDLKESAQDALGGPKYSSFCLFFDFRVSRTRCTRLHAEGAHVALAGFKESAQDAFVRAQDAFFRLFLRFSACEPM